MTRRDADEKGSEEERPRRNFLRDLWDAVNAAPGGTRGERERLAREIERAYRDEPPPTIVLFGEAGVGKSTTINSLFGAGQEVGHTRATTALPQGWEIGGHLVEGTRGLLRVIDMPGVGDDVSTYRTYREMYLRAMSEADVVLWIHPAADRAVAYMQHAIEDLFGALDVKHPPGLVFGLNKADEIHPADWHPVTNTPSREQLANLREREEVFAQSMRRYAPRRTPAPVSYSALRRYRLATLFRAMMDAVRRERRWVLESRMALADLEALIDRGALDFAKRLAADPPELATDRAASSGDASDPSPADGADVVLSETARRLAALPRAEYDRLIADRKLLVRWIAENEPA